MIILGSFELVNLRQVGKFEEPKDDTIVQPPTKAMVNWWFGSAALILGMLFW